MSGNWREPVFSTGLAALLQEVDALRRTLLNASLDHSLSGSDQAVGGEVDGDELRPLPAEERLTELLKGLRRIMLFHPSETQSVVSFLISEGHAYARTTEGRARYAGMIGSPELARLRTLWETTSLNLFDGPVEPDGVPTSWTELIRDLFAGAGIDRLLLSLRPEGLA